MNIEDSSRGRISEKGFTLIELLGGVRIYSKAATAMEVWRRYVLEAPGYGVALK